EIADAPREVREVRRFVAGVAAGDGEVRPIVDLRVEIVVDAGGHVPWQARARRRESRELKARGQRPAEGHDELMRAVGAGRPLVGAGIEPGLREVLEVLDVAQRL